MRYLMTIFEYNVQVSKFERYRAKLESDSVFLQMLSSYHEQKKIVSSNFWKTFLSFWHKIRCIVPNKKEKLFVKKNAYHTISIYGKCVISIFLMATIKIFQSIFEIVPKIFFVFYNRKLIFVLKHFLKKKICLQNLFFLCV